MGSLSACFPVTVWISSSELIVFTLVRTFSIFEYNMIRPRKKQLAKESYSQMELCSRNNMKQDEHHGDCAGVVLSGET